MARELNILLVDDSTRILEQVKLLLHDYGHFKITTAIDVKGAKEIIRGQALDIAVLDINLPDGNGLDILKWIKADYPDIRVIMFSNNSGKLHREMSQKYGAEYFLDKTNEFEKLAVILSEMAVE